VTELHVHDWAPWGLSPLSDAAGVVRRQRSCLGCELYQDEPIPGVTSVGLVPDSAIEAAAEADYGRMRGDGLQPWAALPDSFRDSFRANVRPVVAAAVPHIERAIRDKISAEIAALVGPESDEDDVYRNNAYFRASRVARGGEATE
jgi:hypothetical protein